MALGRKVETRVPTSYVSPCGVTNAIEMIVTNHENEVNERTARALSSGERKRRSKKYTATQNSITTNEHVKSRMSLIISHGACRMPPTGTEVQRTRSAQPHTAHSHTQSHTGDFTFQGPYVGPISAEKELPEQIAGKQSHRWQQPLSRRSGRCRRVIHVSVCPLTSPNPQSSSEIEASARRAR
eukprot:725722-Prymnesium_polylepis.3